MKTTSPISQYIKLAHLRDGVFYYVLDAIQEPVIEYENQELVKSLVNKMIAELPGLNVTEVINEGTYTFMYEGPVLIKAMLGESSKQNIIETEEYFWTAIERLNSEVSELKQENEKVREALRALWNLNAAGVDRTRIELNHQELVQLISTIL
jgi:hypothetical protein